MLWTTAEASRSTRTGFPLSAPMSGRAVRLHLTGMNGQILVFKSILTQAENTRTNIPDMFWYRMYESFKFMLYQLRRMDATEEQFSGTLDYLETYLQKLTAHDRAIRPLYRRYTKSAVVERLRDEALMSPRRSESAFQGLKKRMVRDYQENQSK